jgi:hypothetical protein
VAERACPKASFIEATLCGRPAIAVVAVLEPLVSLAVPASRRVDVCTRLSTGWSTRSTVEQIGLAAQSGVRPTKSRNGSR